MNVKSFFHEQSHTYTYLIYEGKGGECVVIDPVLNFDYASACLNKKTLDPIQSYIDKNNLNLVYILETHIHADHFTGAAALKKIYPKSKIGISSAISSVFETFKKVFDLHLTFSYEDIFDLILDHGEILNFSGRQIKIINTPGHTPACVCYHIDDHLFTGDTLFMPDFGTGRCDFPGGCASSLFHSITEKLYKKIDDAIVHVGHDYGAPGRAPIGVTSLSESRKNNIHLPAHISEGEFVSFRNERDATLSYPKLLFPSIQYNMLLGKLGEKKFLKIPLSWEA